jgi:Lon protease-like protein
VLPLRDIVVFPHMIVPLFVGREKSIKALEEVMRSDTFILLATQKNASDDDPATGAIFEIGTLASVLQLLKLPDGTVKVLVEGAARAKVERYTDRAEYYEADAVVLADSSGEQVEAEALARSVINEFENYVKLNKKVSPEVVGVVQQIEDYAKLADTVASHLAVKIPDKQVILETPSVTERLEKVLGLMENQEDQALEGGARKGHPRAQEAAPDVADVGGGDGGAQLSRLAALDPMEQEEQGQEGPRARPGDPGRRSLRPGEGQGADRRVSRRPAACQQAERADPVLGRTARRRQDFARKVDRPRDRPRLRARVARRGA